MNQQEWMRQLRNEGYQDVTVCPVGPGQDMGEHTHDRQTVHVILKGELVIKDDAGTQVFGSGDRVEFPAGTTHRASVGAGEFLMIVGVR